MFLGPWLFIRYLLSNTTLMLLNGLEKGEGKGEGE